MSLLAPHLCILSFISLIHLNNGLSKSRCTDSLQQTYDFIIVGGGSSGSDIANRLSEDPNISVLLLEAGSSDQGIPEASVIETPVLRSTLLDSSDKVWRFRTDPQSQVFQSSSSNTSDLHGGKILGGSSAINAVAYVRGSKSDFDSWTALGAEGWSYKDVLPFFLKSEGTRIPEFQNSSKYHNTCGPLEITAAEKTSLANLVFKGANEIGYPTVECNQPTPLGICLDQKTISSGQSNTAAKVFLHNILGRPNLTVLTYAFVTRVLINSTTKTAVGVEFTYQGQIKQVKVRKEVVLAAGTFSSPKLLQLSGIGPKSLLQRLNITVISEVPAGENLQDGLVLFTRMFLDVPTRRIENYTDPVEVAKYIFKREGIYTQLSFANLLVKTQSAGDPGLADVLLFFRDGIHENIGILNEYIFKNKSKSTGRDAITVAIHAIHTKSRGYVSIKDQDPATLPQVDPRYFNSSYDFAELYRGIKIAEKLANSTSFKAVNAQFEELIPECSDFKFGGYDYWKCYASFRAISLGHSVGTCRMGRLNDSKTVVDSRLRVKGVHGLRVADASIMPEATSGGIYASVLMIGEKAAHMIKEDNLC